MPTILGLQNCTLSDIIANDNTYLDRVKLRRSLVEAEPNAVIRCNSRIVPAVNELYAWFFGVYLPRRFPTMFELDSDDRASEPTLRNKVTNENIPLAPSPDPLVALKTLASHIDTDIFLLLPSTCAEDDGKYILEAYINCFPSGFDPREKLSRKLADIHIPVPRYGDKLEKSMDRFFAGLPNGKIVKRHNWTINTSPELFKLAGTHLHEGDDEKPKDIDVERTFLRCERQTLHRLPNTGALVFAFKTYQYPLAQIKAEGNGDALAEAIEGIQKGSTPELYKYKSGVVWGESVKSYLRSVT